MKWFLYLLPIAILFSPDFKIVSGLPSVRVEDFLIIIFMLFVLVDSFKSKNQKLFIVDKFNSPLFFWFWVAIISILLQELLFNRNIVLNDVMVLPMLIKYILIYQLVKISLQNKNLLPVLDFVIILGVFSAVIGILQYHNVGEINLWLTPLYVTDEVKIQTLIDMRLMARAAGTVGDPRHYSFFLVAIGGLLFSNILEKRRVKFYLFFLFVILVALIYTLSRTGVVAFGFLMIGNLLFVSYTHKRVEKLFIYLFFFIVSFGIVISMFKTSGFEERVLDTQTKSFQYSRHARIRDLQQPINEAINHPEYLLFGAGPSKAFTRTSGHNDFGVVLRMYGILALAAYILILYKSISSSIQLYRKTKSKTDRIISLANANIFVTWFVFALAEDLFRNIQIMPLNMFFLGMLGFYVYYKDISSGKINQPTRGINLSRNYSTV
jgi:hypothetical protein